MQVCTSVFGNTASIASGNPFRTVDDGDQDVFRAAVLEFVHDGQPVECPGFLDT